MSPDRDDPRMILRTLEGTFINSTCCEGDACPLADSCRPKREPTSAPAPTTEPTFPRYYQADLKPRDPYPVPPPYPDDEFGLMVFVAVGAGVTALILWAHALGWLPIGGL